MGTLEMINECESYGLIPTHPEWVGYQEDYMILAVCRNRTKVGATIEEVFESFGLPMPYRTRDFLKNHDFLKTMKENDLIYAINYCFEQCFLYPEKYVLGLRAFMLSMYGCDVPCFN